MQSSQNTRRHCRVVCITGDIDDDTAPRMAKELEAALAEGQQQVYIDPSGITFMTSAGLDVLVRFYNSHEVTIGRGNPLVDKVIAITALQMLYGETT